MNLDFKFSPLFTLFNTPLLWKKMQVFPFLLFFFFSGQIWAATPSKTPQNIQKKAVIIKHNAKIFKKASGDEGGEARFMRIFFLMEPEMNDRIPVSISPNKTGKPDGWLAKGSYQEWNTLQMIKMEPQSGRVLAKIFETESCSNNFARKGTDSPGCVAMGEEPNHFTAKKKQPNLLIPVFQKKQESYEAGFIRVFENQKSVTPTAGALNKQGDKKDSSNNLGYDIVFVVDATGSMGEYFKPTTEVLQTFIEEIQAQTGIGELKTNLNVGILFYRDRKTGNDCDIGFLTKWGQELTDKIEKVSQALKSTDGANCGSDEIAEAVLDGLNRAIVDTKWHDNFFRAIFLVGDAPPHAANSPKNPFNFTAQSILKNAGEKSIRFLTFKLGSDDSSFKNLAYAAEEANRGRYSQVSISNTPKKEEFQESLLSAIQNEWALLNKAQIISNAGVDPTQSDVMQKYQLEPYEALIIKSRLPSKANSQGVPEFVNGWIPQKVDQKLIVDEYIFMGRSQLKILTNTLDNLNEAAAIGQEEGGDAFIDAIRNSLAAQLKIAPDKLFTSGETLDGMLAKANILPFKTQILSFTAQEVQDWKSQDYQRISTILEEKVRSLREFTSNPANQHRFGNVAHFYVPRPYFP